jgi:hypothetical protein
VKKSNFLLIKKPHQQLKFIDYEVVNVNGGIRVDEWGFLPDQEVVENFIIEMTEKAESEGNKLCLEGKITENNVIHSYFAIYPDRIAIQMSHKFAKRYDMVVCMASQEIVASTRVFPSNK